MKTLYLECAMGAAGDMLTAALLELHPDPSAVLERLNAALPDGVNISAEPCTKCGITGTRVNVTVNGEEEECSDEPHSAEAHSGHVGTDGHHGHRGIVDIENIIYKMDLPEKAKGDAVSVYRLLAQAESRVHGAPVSEIHFHEIGTMDAVADIAAVSLLIGELAPDRIIASPVCVGGGYVRCAHGILPVPAPAVAELLRGVPIYGGTIRSELCTPTGAALLRHFASDFAPLPLMRIAKLGYGMGKKDFEKANCVRAMIGEA